MTENINIALGLYIITCALVPIVLLPYKKNTLGRYFVIHTFIFRGNIIYQTKWRTKENTCFKKMRAFALQTAMLPAELPIGKYSMVTHEGVLKRIQRAEYIEVISIRKTYKASLKRNISAICQCSKCAKSTKCQIHNQEKVQFYKIKIKKTMDSI